MSEHTCLCCGESVATIGVCVSCVQKDCNVSPEKPCKRNGSVDPHEITGGGEAEAMLKKTTFRKGKRRVPRR